MKDILRSKNCCIQTIAENIYSSVNDFTHFLEAKQHNKQRSQTRNITSCKTRLQNKRSKTGTVQILSGAGPTQGTVLEVDVPFL